MNSSVYKVFLQATLLVAATSITNAQPVLLESLDGTISITGELTSHDSENYVIETNLGNMSIPVSQVNCIGAACPEIMPAFTEFTISGPRNLSLELLPDLLDGFGNSLDLEVTHLTSSDGNPKVIFTNFDGTDIAEVSVSINSSTRALGDLVSAESSIALMSRPVRQTEKAAILAAGFGDITTSGQERILALDGLVIITSTQNRLRTISESALAQVFAGRIANWAELGGNDAPINIYVSADNTDTGSMFAQLVMQPRQMVMARNVIQLSSDSAVSDAISVDPNGIGFTTFSNERSSRSLAISGSCGIQSPATNFAIKTEEYPYSRRMYLYYLQDRLPVMAGKFIEYLNTAEAQKIVSFSGFVDQGATEEPVNNQGLRFVSAILPTRAETTLPALQAMIAELGTAQRLSTTFRFDQVTAQLDSRSNADIARLARRIESGQLADKEIMLIGFTGSVGVASDNADLSLERANQIRARLLSELAPGTFNPANIRAIGYGEMSPLACNDTISGRQVNRRIEVWSR